MNISRNCNGFCHIKNSRPYIGMPVYIYGESDGDGIYFDDLIGESFDNEALDDPADKADRSGTYGCYSLYGLPPAMAYVPMQEWEEPFEMAEGFAAGTIFPSLDFPFRGGSK